MKKKEILKSVQLNCADMLMGHLQEDITIYSRLSLRVHYLSIIPRARWIHTFQVLADREAAITEFIQPAVNPRSPGLLIPDIAWLARGNKVISDRTFHLIILLTFFFWFNIYIHKNIHKTLINSNLSLPFKIFFLFMFFPTTSDICG